MILKTHPLKNILFSPSFPFCLQHFLRSNAAAAAELDDTIVGEAQEYIEIGMLQQFGVNAADISKLKSA